MTAFGISADPIPTTLAGVRDGICCWFGGIHDPATRSYRNPQVPGLGVVRRSRPKVLDTADYYVGQPSSGALLGSTMFVHLDSWTESRVAMAGAFGGLKLVQAAVVLHVWLRSTAPETEDAQDGFYELLEALGDRLREDRCVGTGGFEAGGFQIGEGGAPWITWQVEPAEVASELTTAYASSTFKADFYRAG